MRWFRSAKQWMNATRFFDAFYALFHEHLPGFRHVLGEIGAFRRQSPRKKPNYQPQIEGLEVRQMPATYTWTGLGSDNHWTTAANWSSSTVPGTSDTAVINNSSDNVDLTANEQVANLTLSAGTLTGAYTLTVTGSSSSWSGGTISGTDTLKVNSGATLGISGSGASLTATLDNAGTVNWTSGAIAINSATVINESGATFTMAGGLNLTDGSINSTFTNDGTLNVGGVNAAGTNQLAVTFTQGSTGVLAVEIQQTTGSVFDQLEIGGSASLNGTLQVRPLSGLSVSIGNSFNVFTAGTVSGTISGTFASLNGTSFGVGNALDVTYSSTIATVGIVAAPDVQFSASTMSVSESATYAVLTVTLSGSCEQSISLDYATSDGTALAGVDYTTTSGTVTFPGGTTSESIDVPLLHDIESSSVTFAMTLSNSTIATLSSPSVETVTITQPFNVQFTAAASDAYEDDAYTTITAVLSQTWGSSVTVNYATSNGTATAGQDYTATSGTLTFTAGVTSQSFQVPLLDYLESSSVHFSVTLSSPSVPVLGSASTETVTILQPPTIQYSSSSYTANETDSSATITATLSNAWDQSVEAQYSTVPGGTAVPNVGYTPTTGEIAINAGYTSTIFTLPLLDPNLFGGSQTVDLTMEGGPVTAFPLPSGSSPSGIVAGPDGNLWFTDPGTNEIGKITTAGFVTEYSIPTSSAGLGAITVGPDGNLWFTEYNTSKIGKITTAGAVTEYSLTSGSDPAGITAGPDGKLWFTEPGTDKIGKITTSGTGLTEYTITTGSSDPTGITAGPDGNLWFIENAASQIGKITTSGTGLTEYSISGPADLTGITAGPDGNLWATGYNSDQIFKITTGGTVTVTAYSAGSVIYPAAITSATDGNLWYANLNSIDSITTGGAVAEYGIPGPGYYYETTGIAQGSDGNIWFTDAPSGVGHIGKLKLDFSTATLTIIDNAALVTDDPGDGPLTPDGNVPLVPIGEVSVDINAGAARVSQPLDFDISPGTDIGGNPALVYNSATVDVQPVIQLSVPTNASLALPTDIKLQLTWDGGSPQSWVTYTPDTLTQSPGDTFAVAVQDDAAVAESGLYDWSVEVEVDLAGGGYTDTTYAGSAPVVVQDSSVTGQVDPYGAGWGIFSVDRLVPVTGGVIWVDGTGNGRLFADNGSGGYIDPADDFGTLVQTPDAYTISAATESGSTVTITTSTSHDFQVGQSVTIAGISPSGYDGAVTIASVTGTTFTYAAASGLGTATLSSATATGHTWSYNVNGAILSEGFNRFGMETSIVTTDNLTRTYAYDGSDHLTKVVAGDLGTTTLAYDSSGFLTSIAEPGRTVALSQSDGAVSDLTHLTDGASYGRGLAYDGDNHLTSDAWAPYNTTLTYASTGLLSEVNLGSGSTYDLVSAAALPMQSSTPIELAQANLPTITDALTHVTGYELDSSRREIEQFSPVGLAGSITAASWASNIATITANNSFVAGETVVIAGMTPSGYNGTFTILSASSTQFTYAMATSLAGGTVFGTATAQPDSNQSWAYESHGLVTSYTDPDGNVTSYTYDAYGQLASETDPVGDTTSYSRDSTSYDNVTKTIDGGSITTTASYDSLGEMTQSTDGDGYATTYSWSGYRMTQMVDPDSDTTTYGYDSHLRLIQTVDPNGKTSTTGYDASGNLSSTVDPDLHTTSYSYDGDNNLVAQHNPAGDSATYSYDAAGFQTASNVGGVPSSTSYDSRGWVTSSSDGDGDTTGDQLDVVGNATAVVDGRGYTTTQKFDIDGDATQSVNPDSDTTTYKYDKDGNVTQTIDPDLNTTTQAYDADGRLLSTTDPLGHSTSQGYDLFGRTTLTTDGDGNTEQTRYDKDDNVTASVDGNGKTTSYSFDHDDRLTATVDPDTYTTRLYYDKDGNVTASVDADSKTTTMSYDSADNPTKTVDPDSATTLQYYDGDNRATETVDPDLHTTFMYYDPAGNVTATVDGDLHTSTTSFDGDGNVVSTLDGAGDGSSTSFDQDGNVATSVDGDSNATTNYYDHADRLTMSVAPGGETSYQYYDSAGYLTASVDGDNHTTTYVNDADGDATKIINADTKTTLQSFDGDQQIVSTTDPDGHGTSTGFDHDGQVTSSTDGAGHTSYSYFDPDGRVTKSIDGAGHTTLNYYDPDGYNTETVDGDIGATYSYYDPAGYLTKTVDPDVYTTLMSYDLAGLVVTKETDPDGHRTLSSYDSAGFLTKTTVVSGSTMLYYNDGDGNVTESVDGDLQTTLYIYDGNGNDIMTVDAGHTSTTGYDGNGNVTLSVANGQTTQMLYDLANNNTETIDSSGGTTHYAYDPANYLTKVTDPDSNVTSYTLDGDGYATIVFDPHGYTTLQSFDGDGRVTQRITAVGATVNFTYDGDGNTLSNGNGTFTYDNDGNMKTASNSNGTYSFSYDGDDRLTQVAEPFGVTLNYAYDRDGNQTQVTDSFGGTETSSYDSNNYLTERTYSGQTQTLRFDFTNNEEGQPTTISRYSDLAGTTLVATTYESYDGEGNTTNVASYQGTSTLIDEFAYSLDSNDNVTKLVSTQGGTATTTSYSYDSGGQLTSAGGSSYGYDSNGNRDNGSNVVGTGNQLTTDGTWTYYYDHDGNLGQKDSTTGGSSERWLYSYNSVEEMTEAQHYNSGGTLVLTVDYSYDGFGNLIEESAGTLTTKYAVDGWNPNAAPATGNAKFNDWAVLNSGNTLQTRNIFGNDASQILARVDQTGASDPAGTYWDLTDREGSVRDVINNSGTVKDSLAYDAWGNVLSGSNANPTYAGWYQWTGQQRDAETGLQLNDVRWYDPTTGRWQSQDPLGFDAGDSNLYRYVNNRPDVATDPSGLQDGPATTQFGGTQKDAVYLSAQRIGGSKMALKDNSFELDGKRVTINAYSDATLKIKTSDPKNAKDIKEVEAPNQIVIEADFGGLSLKGVHFLQMVRRTLLDKDKKPLMELGISTIEGTRVVQEYNKSRSVDRAMLEPDVFNGTGDGAYYDYSLHGINNNNKWITDRPSANGLGEKMRKDAVIEEAIFDTYVVYDEKVCYLIQWKRVWTRQDSGKWDIGTYSLIDSKRTNELLPEDRGGTLGGGQQIRDPLDEKKLRTLIIYNPIPKANRGGE